MVNCCNRRKGISDLRADYSAVIFLDVYRCQSLPVVAGDCVHRLHRVNGLSITVELDQMRRSQPVPVGSVHRGQRRVQPVCPYILRLLRVVLDQVCRCEYLATCSADSMYWLIRRTAHRSSGIAERVRNRYRFADAAGISPCNGIDRIFHAASVTVSAVVALNNERFPALNRELVHAPDDASQSIVGQRPDCIDAVLFLDLLLGGKDGIHRHCPVNDLRSGAPRLALAAFDLLAVAGCMGTLRPADRLPVTPGNQYKALACGWRTVICRHQFPVLHRVAQRLKL